jgi:hypothetical protein
MGQAISRDGGVVHLVDDGRFLGSGETAPPNNVKDYGVLHVMGAQVCGPDAFENPQRPSESFPIRLKKQGWREVKYLGGRIRDQTVGHCLKVLIPLRR